VPATALAAGVGNIVAATMVMAGAYATATGLVSVDSLSAAVADALPSYRAQHVALNQAAIKAGAGAVAGISVAAWAIAKASTQ
jgi:Pyruvate/2-oxoacid:ferredoxin oxidoreductase gamma subunit